MNLLRWCCLGAMLLASPASAKVTFTRLGDLPGGRYSSAAFSVSADGSMVAGTSRAVSDYHAFRWTSFAGMIDLSESSADFRNSYAERISSDGSTVVGNGLGDRGYEAFRWNEDEGVISLGDLLPIEASFSYAHGTSADGSIIVGHYLVSSVHEPFYWTAEEGIVQLFSTPKDCVFTDISDDGKTVVGVTYAESGGAGFSWSATDGFVELSGLPGGSLSVFTASVSADGSTIVGQGSNYLNESEAIRWTAPGEVIGLGDLPGGAFYSYASDVSADGSRIVGHSADATGYQAILWDQVNGMRSIYDLLVAEGIDMSGWRLTDATGISADGRIIVGAGQSPLGDEAWLVNLGTPVPEPTALLMAGCAVLAWLSQPRSARVRRANP